MISEREQQIVTAGAKLAAKHGAENVTRRMVAKACNVSDPLVSHYIGAGKTAQARYIKQAKKMGLVLPSKEKAAAAGMKLRAKGPVAVKSTRKRSVKEVQAIKRKVAIKVKATGKLKPLPKPKVIAAAPENKVIPAAPENKAARLPKLPPPGFKPEA